MHELGPLITHHDDDGGDGDGGGCDGGGDDDGDKDSDDACMVVRVDAW